MSDNKFYFDNLNGEEFENYLKSLFENLNYKVELTPKTGDYGADLIIYKNEKKTVVQAKRYSDQVGISAIQEVIGAISYYSAIDGIVVTNNYFTPNAINLAESANIELWDRDILINKVVNSFVSDDNLSGNDFQINTPLLKDFIHSDMFKNLFCSCPIILGIDSNKNLLIDDLNNLHHLLIKGNINSGKSNFLNCLILSFLYKNPYDSLKLLLIDTKGLEFSNYNETNFLLTPLVSESKKVSSTLNWLTEEMNTRYRLLTDAQMKNLESYNNYAYQKHIETLPRIIIIIDEISEAFEVDKQKIMNSLSSLILKSNHVGIHIIVTTQNKLISKSLENLFPSVIQLISDRRQYIMTLNSPYQKKELKTYIPYVSQNDILDILDEIALMKRNSYLKRLDYYEEKMLYKSKLSLKNNTNKEIGCSSESEREMRKIAL